MGKLVAGVNDLATLFPEVAKEAEGWDPKTVTANSGKKVLWSCHTGHQWEATVNDRTPPKSSGCPYCLGVRAVKGVNDLETLHPEVAREAYGWDPTTVKSGSQKKLPWVCELGHKWQAVVSSRTPPYSAGCPVCAGKQAWAGFNDLATLFPTVAAEAYGWDPSTLTPGSSKKVSWSCVLGHRWDAQVKTRTPPQNSGCPFCTGKQVLAGFNDLKTLFPELAGEACGWDPSKVKPGSDSKFRWLCEQGHTWLATPKDRKPPKGTGCPVCTSKEVASGFNDLASQFPDLAREAEGWDPRTVTPNSQKSVLWKCAKGHQYKSRVAQRTPPQRQGCPVCAGREVLKGFNDLSTLFPDLGKEADGWDPSTVTAGSNRVLRWRCKEGHTWETQVNNRTPPANSGCPECAEFGFKTTKEAWFYLLERPGEQQLGVTNNLDDRLRHHVKHGWSEVEVVGPFPGEVVLTTEKSFKRWLKAEVGLVPGTHENWFTAKLEVQSLAELKAKSGVETELF